MMTRAPGKVGPVWNNYSLHVMTESGLVHVDTKRLLNKRRRVHFKLNLWINFLTLYLNIIINTTYRSLAVTYCTIRFKNGLATS